MAGLPKKTGLKTDPQDAEFYRKHHDEVLNALQRGFSPEQIQKELAAKGVPEKTASRIAIAVEQEVALSVEPKSGQSNPQFWLFTWVGPTLWIAVFLAVIGGAYVAWHYRELDRFPWRKVSWAGLFAVAAAIELLRRHRRNAGS